MTDSVAHPPGADPVITRHRDLERIAMVALDCGRMLMETGARSRVARDGAAMVARGLGAERVHVRVGYTSIGMTVGAGANTITRMMGIGAHRVDLRLNHAVCRVCVKVAGGGRTPDQAGTSLAVLGRSTPRHGWLVVALAVGLACASFGRLLGMDWVAFSPVLLAGAVAQAVRHGLSRMGVNVYAAAALVAFVAASGGGLGSALLGSGTEGTAMIAAVLLLVPGVPMLNAQTDIMEGSPTLGSARMIGAVMVLVFITVGVWCAQALLGVSAAAGPPPTPHGVLHQMAFGALAAACFGVLFNFGWVSLAWAAGAGALALGVRTLGLEAGWSLVAASFAAAACVGAAVWPLTRAPARFHRAGTVLGVAGCIPMVPGSAAAQAIMGLFDLAAPDPLAAGQTLLSTVEYALRASFTVGAIGAGLAITGALLRSRDFPKQAGPHRRPGRNRAGPAS